MTKSPETLACQVKTSMLIERKMVDQDLLVCTPLGKHIMDPSAPMQKVYPPNSAPPKSALAHLQTVTNLENF